MSTSYFALGLGIGTQNSNGEWLEVFYPQPVLNPSADLVTALAHIDSGTVLSREVLLELESILDAHDLGYVADTAALFANSERPSVLTVLTEDAPPANVPEGYLKLQLLSHRLVKPHQVNLEGLFGKLPNVAWTNEGAIDLNELPARQLKARVEGRILEVSCVDKFPKMTNYVVPSGVRIAHTARVRLGAYLGEGTTVMHEGFINFNAGTEGPGMIEGRISAGVMVGAGSDLGGSASTLGTLSGGNNVVISVGQGCLIGANAGTGIPLGDRCTIESGLFVTAGSLVTVLDSEGQQVDVLKARELAEKSDLLFRRNSQSGAIECLTNKSAIALNEELHAHN
jgi:2,3,4,5-tetrahydropyridine-2-carboxylate N-succinyltransferase